MHPTTHKGREINRVAELILWHKKPSISSFELAKRHITIISQLGQQKFLDVMDFDEEIK